MHMGNTLGDNVVFFNVWVEINNMSVQNHWSNWLDAPTNLPRCSTRQTYSLIVYFQHSLCISSPPFIHAASHNRYPYRVC